MEAIDTQLFYWINGHHCTVADWVLWIASQPWSWAVVILAIFYFTTLRHEPRQWWIVLLGIGLCFLLADRISVLCFKDVFCRPRPCHALDNVRMFRTNCAGLYGFVSSHAANVFALATLFVVRYWKSCRRWLLPTASIWALLVAYSRPYLGKHYPGDVICGALLGIILGLLVFLVVKYVSLYFKKRST